MSKKIPLYLCDKKREECNGPCYRECRLTHDIDHAVRDGEGNPIVITYIEHYYGTGIIAVRKEDIDAMPDIVRCKDCKHFESEYGYCDYYQWNMTGGDFCSKAEKREVTT